MKNKEIISSSFLFSGVDGDTIEAILSQKSRPTSFFKRGDLVYSSMSEERLVGFIISGRCEIRIERSCGRNTILNVLTEGDSFGILSVYSAEEYPTKIYATKNTEILFFTDNEIRYFVNNSSQISNNLITFLAEKITFLNKKISAFSASTVEDRLAVFILCEAQRIGGDSFDLNCQRTSREINAGRTSIYRALISLSEGGYISFDKKTVKILDREGLERITK